MAGKRKYKRWDRALYCVYHSILSRCYKPNNPNYKYYGKRGVTVCDEWKNNRGAFYEWAFENGWEKGKHIDKDIKGNPTIYSPESCSIVDPKVNLSFPKKITNRTKRLFLFNGYARNLIDICKEQNISYHTVSTRLHRNPKMSIYNAVKPSRYKYKSKTIL